MARRVGQPAPTAAVREIAGECLCVRARMLSRALSALYDRVVGEGEPGSVSHGLTISQVNLLVATGMHGSISPNRLGRSLHMERSTVSRNIAPLLERGLLDGETAESDAARLRAVRLTPTGEKAIREVLPRWRKAQAEARAMLGEPGTGAVMQLGSRLFAQADVDISHLSP